MRVRPSANRSRCTHASGHSCSAILERCPGVLAAADVFTASTTFWVMESLRLDLGFASQVHP